MTFKLVDILAETNISWVSSREFKEMKDFLLSGGVLQNEAAGYQIFILPDGQRIFFYNDKYYGFRNQDAFIRAACRIYKRGGIPSRRK